MDAGGIARSIAQGVTRALSPVKRVLSPPRIRRKCYRFWLQRSQWWNRERIRKHQTRLLSRLLWHAYRNVPYYRRVFDRCSVQPSVFRTPEDMCRFPILTKEDVRENAADMRAEPFARYGPVHLRTGGTTGTAMEFYVSRAAVLRAEALAHRHWGWAGFDPRSDRVVTMRGAILTAGPEEDAPYDIAGNSLTLSSFHMSERSFATYARLIEEFKPKVIRAYPSAILIMTRGYLDLGVHHCGSVRSIITSSETLQRSSRAVVQEFWGCPLFDWYGQGEHVGWIEECDEHRYHVNEELSYVEFVPSSAPGQFRIVATSLYNTAMPFIRYDTGDLASLGTSEACPCGRASRTVESIDGRIEDIVVAKGGRLVGRLDRVFKYSPGIECAQITQECAGAICIKFVKNDRFAEAELEKVRGELLRRLGPDMEICFECVPEIRRTPSGKLRFVVSKVGRSYLGQMLGS